MVDTLRGLGERLLCKGYSTPFLSMGSAYMYPSLDAAKDAVAAVGQQVATDGLVAGVGPLTFAFTATGNVSQGAQEIFQLLPHEMVSCDDLKLAVRSAFC
jgi:alpha-aminoadipic semialdehyde synthase